MKWKKRFLSAILCLCMILTLIPTVAFAEEIKSSEYKATSDYVYVNGVELTNGSYWKNGDTIKPTGNSSNYNAYFSNGTLYLRNASISRGNTLSLGNDLFTNIGIIADRDFKINVSGNNKITNSTVNSIGICSRVGSVNITGDGTISIGTRVTTGDFDGNIGIYTLEDLNISNTTVIVNAGADGIQCGLDFTVSNATVTCNSCLYCGIDANTMTVTNSKIEAGGFWSPGIYTGSLTVSGKSLIYSSGSLSGSGRGPGISGKTNTNGLTVVAGEYESQMEPISNFDSKSHENYNYIAIYSPAYSSNRFLDVSSSDWFYNAVGHAYNTGIASGTSAIRFSPSANCTRGQVMTMLWRAMGSPDPSGSGNPFTDIRSSDYYYKAVLWAYQEGITSGTSTTQFSPSSSCTRAQVMTFIWNAKNKPSASGSISFKDVNSSNYYYNAVRWAVKNGITSGTTSTTFSPNKSCTRAEVVTFLYKAMT